MQPIVDGLTDDYNTISFVSINALDSADGETWFSTLALRGHPATLIFTLEGDEVYRSFGVIDESTLREELDRLSR